MRKIIAIALIAIGGIAGCKHLRPPKKPEAPPIETPTFSQYHLESFSWNSVGRVLVLPLLNDSPYTRAADEIGRAMRAELQTLGRFEVVAAPPDAQARLAAEIHRHGRFNEATMLEIARDTRADIVLHGTITQYSPYPRPRLGLVLQAVSPAEAKVVASVDGLWDSTRYEIAARIRGYYRMNPHKHPWVVNHSVNEDDSYSGELALDSPQLFQRYVCAEAIINLVKDFSAVAARFEEAQCPEKPNLAKSKKNTPAW